MEQEMRQLYLLATSGKFLNTSCFPSNSERSHEKVTQVLQVNENLRETFKDCNKLFIHRKSSSFLYKGSNQLPHRLKSKNTSLPSINPQDNIYHKQVKKKQKHRDLSKPIDNEMESLVDEYINKLKKNQVLDQTVNPRELVHEACKTIKQQYMQNQKHKRGTEKLKGKDKDKKVSNSAIAYERSLKKLKRESFSPNRSIYLKDIDTIHKNLELQMKNRRRKERAFIQKMRIQNKGISLTIDQ